MNQTKMEFKKNHCIFDKMIWPDNDDWIHDLIDEAKEKKEKLLTKEKKGII